MNSRIRFLLPAGLVVVGVLLAGIYFTRPVTLWVNGASSQVHGPVLTVADALRQAKLGITPDDLISPSLNQLVPASGTIVLERARPVSIWADGLPLTFTSPERIPANLLARVDMRLFPGDILLANGLPVDPLVPLPRADRIYLQYRPARALAVIEDGKEQRVFSSAETLGEALWSAGLAMRPGDRISLALDTALIPGLRVEMARARVVNILVEGRQVVTHSAAKTVGAALAEEGLSLQGLDYSQPGETGPLPADGNIRVVRVREELAFDQTTLPYNSTYSPDPNLELDQRSVMVPGRLGVRVSRVRVRLEDGKEVSRQAESEWVASQPQDQVLGYGTQIVVKSMSTPDGNIEYYRAVPMYATSYSPCQQGMGRCSRSTSSGALLQKGIVAVTLPWYRMFKGAEVYIPGYGIATIADVGGGIPGVHWIDLGYSDEDYEGWSQTVTVYFLTPAPASAPPILP